MHLGIAFLLLRRQVDTRQMEVPQGVFQDGFLGHVETGGFRAARQGFEGLEQFTVLAQLGGVGAQGWQAGFIGFTQFRAVAHRVQVAHRAPGGAQAIVELVHRQHQAGPGRLLPLGLEDLRDGGTVVSQDLLDGRLHVLGTDRREWRQVIGL